MPNCMGCFKTFAVWKLRKGKKQRVANPNEEPLLKKINQNTHFPSLNNFFIDRYGPHLLWDRRKGI